MATPAQTTRLIGEVNVVGRVINVFFSLILTVREVDKLKDKDVIAMYRALTGDTRRHVVNIAARQVVSGYVQNLWYQKRGLPIPDAVRINHEARLKHAREAQQMSENETSGADAGAAPVVKEVRKTIRGVIRASLAAGDAEDVVLANVKAAFPESKVTKKDVVWNRNQMLAAGELATPPDPAQIEIPDISPAAQPDSAAA